MAKLTVLLGAGFSRPAGYPLVGDINDRFSRDLTDKLLNHSAGEWQWVDEKNEAALNNGRLSYDLIGYSFVMNQLVRTFIAEYGEFTSTNNYEVFFQYCLDATQDKEMITSVFDRAKAACLEKFPDLPKDYLFVFENPRYSLPVDIINYLVWDILLAPLVEELLDEYAEFLDLLDAYDEVEIFSLNHDMLLEYLLNHRGISFTRGFSAEGSNIAYDGKPLPTFNADFSQGKVKLFKLHGSIDNYVFKHHDVKGSWLYPTDGTSYYLTMDYYERHNAIRIDPKTGAAIEHFNPDVVPKFITGTRKTELIGVDEMYRELYSRFEASVAASERLLISGYSFGDNHINTVLEKGDFKRVVNQNPSGYFPLKVEWEPVRIDSLHQLPSILSLDESKIGV